MDILESLNETIREAYDLKSAEYDAKLFGCLEDHCRKLGLSKSDERYGKAEGTEHILLGVTYQGVIGKNLHIITYDTEWSDGNLRHTIKNERGEVISNVAHSWVFSPEDIDRAFETTINPACKLNEGLNVPMTPPEYQDKEMDKLYYALERAIYPLGFALEDYSVVKMPNATYDYKIYVAEGNNYKHEIRYDWKNFGDDYTIIYNIDGKEVLKKRAENKEELDAVIEEIKKEYEGHE